MKLKNLSRSKKAILRHRGYDLTDVAEGKQTKLGDTDERSKDKSKSRD